GGSPAAGAGRRAEARAGRLPLWRQRLPLPFRALRPGRAPLCRAQDHGRRLVLRAGDDGDGPAVHRPRHAGVARRTVALSHRGRLAAAAARPPLDPGAGRRGADDGSGIPAALRQRELLGALGPSDVDLGDLQSARAGQHEGRGVRPDPQRQGRVAEVRPMIVRLLTLVALLSLPAIGYAGDRPLPPECAPRSVDDLPAWREWMRILGPDWLAKSRA